MMSSTDVRWRAILGDFQRGGLTHVAFCRRKAISVHTFRKRLYGQKAIAPAIERIAPITPAQPTRFLPVTLPPTHFCVTPEADRLTLVLSGGRRLVVGNGFDPETLRRLIDILEQLTGSACPRPSASSSPQEQPISDAGLMAWHSSLAIASIKIRSPVISLCSQIDDMIA